MRIKDLIETCCNIFYDNIIIGTEETTLWIYSYLDNIPEEVLRLHVSGWTVEFVGVMVGDPSAHLVIYI